MAAKQVRRAPRRGLPPTRAFIGVLRRERGLLRDFTGAQGGREPTFWIFRASKTSQGGRRLLEFPGVRVLKKRAPGVYSGLLIRVLRRASGRFWLPCNPAKTVSATKIEAQGGRVSQAVSASATKIWHLLGQQRRANFLGVKTSESGFAGPLFCGSKTSESCHGPRPLQRKFGVCWARSAERRAGARVLVLLWVKNLRKRVPRLWGSKA